MENFGHTLIQREDDVKTQGEGGRLQPEREVSEETNITSTLISDF